MGELMPDDEADDFRWYFKFRCANCGETPEHWQYICATESHPLKGGRGEASCVMKCKLCARENSIDILTDSVEAYNYSDNLKFKTIAAFDCRGLEPVDFSPRNGWKLKGYKEDEDGEGSETGTVFSDVDLSDKEWADYDDKSGESTC